MSQSSDKLVVGMHYFGKPINITTMTELQGEPLTLSHNCWEVADAVMSVSRRVLLRGKPGTGKTYHAVNSALPEGQTVYQITMTEETPAAEIRGHYTVKDGDYVWSDGPAIMAWREGARLIINEIDRASEDCLSLLYAVLDDPEFAQLTLPTGEMVKPADGFQVIATMNGIPEDLPDALQDRLPVDIEITEVNPEAIKRLPEDLRGPAQNSALAPQGERNISIRLWLEFALLREELPKHLKDDTEALQIAAQAVFGVQANDALTALTVAGTISEPQTMDGYILTAQDEAFLKALRHQYEMFSPELGYHEQVWQTWFEGFWVTHQPTFVERTTSPILKPEKGTLRVTRQDGTLTTLDELCKGVA